MRKKAKLQEKDLLQNNPYQALQSGKNLPDKEMSASGQVKLLDQVEVGDAIGEGNFGNVYKGRWEGSDVALKQIKDKEMQQRMLEEALILRYCYFL